MYIDYAVGIQVLAWTEVCYLWYCNVVCVSKVKKLYGWIQNLNLLKPSGNFTYRQV
jgi:hypothetical protein